MNTTPIQHTADPKPANQASGSGRPDKHAAHELPRAVPIDLGSFRAAMAAAEEPARALATLEALLAAAVKSEPELVKRASDGDLSAAAELTVCRLKIRETLPAEIAAARQRLPEIAIAVWDATAALIPRAIEVVSGFPEAMAEFLESKVREALRPYFKNSEIRGLVRVQSSFLPEAQAATDLLAALHRLESEFQEPARPRILPDPYGGRPGKITPAERFHQDCSKSLALSRQAVEAIERYNASIVQGRG